MLSSVIKLCYKQPATEKVCWRKHLRTGWKQWVNMEDHRGQMGCTECDSVLLPAPSSFNAGVQLLWQLSSWVLSYQREIRVNSPFTFVYEEIPLHCLLRPLPPLKSHHRSGRKQGQEWYHICERPNIQLHGCPLVLQDKVTLSMGCNNLDKKRTCKSVKTDSDFLPGDYFRQS